MEIEMKIDITEIERAHMLQLVKKQDGCDDEMVQLITDVENAAKEFDEDKLYQALQNLINGSRRIRDVKERIRQAATNIKFPNLIKVLHYDNAIDEVCSTKLEDEVDNSLIPNGLSLYRTLKIQRKFLISKGITDRIIQNQYLADTKYWEGLNHDE